MAQLTQEVVGVIADTTTQALDQAPQAEMYYPMLQRPENFITVLVRSDGDPNLMAAPVRAALKAVDPNVPLTNITTLEAIAADSMGDRRLAMWMLAAFASLALTLASIGVYSVMAYSVGQRSGEIGLRMAIGAHAADVRGMVLREGMRLAAIGMAIGLIGAFALARAMQSMLFGVGAGEPLIYVGIALLLGLIAALACYLPAQRAARVDPLQALRG
jgi:putative ABC transport system permease protein